MSEFDVEKKCSKSLRKDFPILSRKIDGNNLVYFDNAATSQKPLKVIKALEDYYSNHNANVHRGIHFLSEEASEMYESSRKTVAEFIGAASPSEIIFTSGTTDSLNFVAGSWVRKNLKKGDVILTTNSEHHSNFVPFQQAANEIGAKVEVVEVDKNGEVSLDVWEKRLGKEVKFVAISQASNVLGTIFPVKGICKIAHKVGAVISVDGAQAVPHLPVNVQSLDCDFYSFSGHKMLGPMGIGVLYIKKQIMENLPPFKFGGGMISTVGLESSSWADIPERFEAGTPNVAGAVGLSLAIGYLNNIGMENIRNHELNLLSYAFEKFNKMKALRILGSQDTSKRTGLISFYIDGIHAHDIASVLNSQGIAVRSGHHCAMPLHTSLNIPATVRASFYLYNTKEEIDKLIIGIEKAFEILSLC